MKREKRDRRGGIYGQPCIKPTLHSPRAVTLARVTAGLNQKQLAEKADISPGYMSEVEKGTRSLTPEILVRIAKACGRKPAFLLNPEFAKAPSAADGEEDEPNGRRAA